MARQIKRTLLVKLSVWFILFIIIGTLSHELSHYTVAKSLGYESVLHYSSNSWYGNTELDTIYNEYSKEINEGLPFPKRTEYEVALNKFERDKLLITSGGVLFTIGIGTLAFIILLLCKTKSLHFSNWQWLLVFLSLFWSREIINLIMGLVIGIIRPEKGFFGGDELKISKGLELYEGTIPILLGFIGAIICFYTIFKIIPQAYRKTFILSGLIGGVIGIVFWFFLFGPIILP